MFFNLSYEIGFFKECYFLCIRAYFILKQMKAFVVRLTKMSNYLNSETFLRKPNFATAAVEGNVISFLLTVKLMPRNRLASTIRQPSLGPMEPCALAQDPNPGSSKILMVSKVHGSTLIHSVQTSLSLSWYSIATYL